MGCAALVLHGALGQASVLWSVIAFSLLSEGIVHALGMGLAGFFVFAFYIYWIYKHL